MTIETRPIEAPAVPAEKTVADVLRHAALIIEERGWCQGTETDDAGRVCVEGAFYALGNAPSPSDAWRGFCAALTAITGDLWPWHWNDTPGRTAAEVTAALRAAADAWERDR